MSRSIYHIDTGVVEMSRLAVRTLTAFCHHGTYGERRLGVGSGERNIVGTCFDKRVVQTFSVAIYVVSCNGQMRSGAVVEAVHHDAFL